MTEDLDRSQDRLNNIRAIDPILSALRTISMGSWQAALKRRTNVQTYRMQFGDIYSQVLPFIQDGNRTEIRTQPKIKNVLTIVIGSERGIIGRFNRDIVDLAAVYLNEQIQNNIEIEFFLLGSRIKRAFDQNKLTYTSFLTLSTTSLPHFQLAYEITNSLLNRYESYQIDAVDIIYNAYQGASKYKTRIERLIPISPDFSKRTSGIQPWPPAIVETNPVSLYTQMVKQETAIHFYERLLESAAAEHSARYQLLEEATQNAERLIEELNIAVQMSRRQAITREMQELAAGSGMLKK